MTRKDAGHFAGKHQGNNAPDPALSEAISGRAREGYINCSEAMTISGEFSVTPGEVGRNIDLAEIRIASCQLGLFGYRPEKKIVQPAENISDPLKQSITEMLKDNRLSCSDAFSIAVKLGIKKIDVSAACEKMGVKIIQCQLGAF